MAGSNSGLAPVTVGERAPFIAQNSHDIKMLVQSLESHKGKGSKGRQGFSCRKTSFRLPQLGGREVSSWKMNDWDYKRDDLPTYSRGLFTYNRTDGSPEIAVRGYDKFFNIDEVNDTKWRNIESNTRGPYELSNKENGCIIFIAGLEGDQIIVCSKHSTGLRGDDSANHSLQGKAWLEKHLASVGRTTEQLARELRARNATLVAELCDDSFEEHVLEYSPEDAGLYVHGINLNISEFATYPFHLVQQFADEWGLRKAKYVVKDDLGEVKKFLEKCGETGSWNGRDTEGFVIRCKKKVAGGWSDWFFKYKYDEPYLMYRQWREATKAIIAGKAPRYRKHAKITEAYLIYARQQLARNRDLAKQYQRNHGIIAMREGFLKQQGVKGSDIIRAEEAEEAATGGSTRDTVANVVLVPISTIGCGKTTIASALVSLFGWGHVQNDNITGAKGRPQRFANQLTNALALHPVVIADRNNHQKRERKQIIDDVSQAIPGARFVALHYVHHPKDTMVPLVREVTVARVMGRGDNHQTIRASSKSASEIRGIMEGFFSRFEPASNDSEPDNLFEEIIDMDPREDSRHNLDIVVNALHRSFPKLVPTLPSAEEMDKAMDASLNDYSPQLKHDLSFGDNKKDKKPGNAVQTPGVRAKDRKIEYFAIRISRDQIMNCLHETFAYTDPSESAFFQQLSQTERIQPSFHVTLIHTASAKAMPELWKRYEDKQAAALANGQSNYVLDPSLGRVTVYLKQVVWDNRVMAITVAIKGNEWPCANASPHITIGTADPDIKPVESNNLIARWHSLGGAGDGLIQDLTVNGNTEVHGEVRAVLPTTR